MEKTNRKSVSEKLNVFLPWSNDDDFIEVTEWANGDGCDVTIENKYQTKMISLHYSELDAIKHLVDTLTFYPNNIEDENNRSH